MSEFVIDFPTLGDLAEAWIEQHCRVPDGFARGKPFRLADWQFWVCANRYRVREDAVFVPPEDVGPDNPPTLNQAFTYRVTLTVAPQKTGKGPMSAAFVAFEAVGPSVFGGWAVEGDSYVCAENGCPCGWEYEYLPGEPKGIRHPSPVIQMTATNEDQVDNMYRPLRAMIKLGPLKHMMAVREGFIRIFGSSDDDDFDRIDVVTASANARLGNPISDAEQDEVGLYTVANKLTNVAHTQRRGAAGMGGRTHATTNAWDPAMNSYAQELYESTAKDVFVFYKDPDKDLRDADGKPLKYTRKRDRQKIHEYVYAGSWWVSLDSIEAEAAELLRTDPAEAERFFGNRLVQGSGAFLVPQVYDDAESAWSGDQRISLGFDGSSSGDWTALMAETSDGFQFTPTYGPDQRPAYWNPQEWGGRIPRSEVHAAVSEVFARFEVKRMYCDTRDWQTEIDDWAQLYGDEVVVEWPTYAIQRMFDALNRYANDLEQGAITHDGDKVARAHALNAIKLAKPGDKYILGKPADHQKIDILMARVLAHEAAADARASGWEDVDNSVFVFT